MLQAMAATESNSSYLRGLVQFISFQVVIVANYPHDCAMSLLYLTHAILNEYMLCVPPCLVTGTEPNQDKICSVYPAHFFLSGMDVETILASVPDESASNYQGVYSRNCHRWHCK